MTTSLKVLAALTLGVTVFAAPAASEAYNCEVRSSDRAIPKIISFRINEEAGALFVTDSL